MSRVTLTFDNGPTPGITDHVLDVLKMYDVRATFFLVGRQLKLPEGRELAERAHAEGHWIGNHTMTHGPPLGERSEPDVVEREIDDMERLLGPLAHASRLFRPNGRGKIGPHLLSTEACNYLMTHNATVVLWTHIPRDRGVAPDIWVSDARNASSEVGWPLLVLHDRPSGHDIPTGSMAYLEHYLEWARNTGIEIVQDFPRNCLPIIHGRACMPLNKYVQNSSKTEFSN